MFRRQFTERLYAASTPFESDLPGQLFEDFDAVVSLNANFSAGSTQHTDSPHSLVEELVLKVDSEPVVQLDGQDAKHLSTFFNRTAVVPTASGANDFTTTGGGAFIAGRFNLPFSRMMPGAGLDARVGKCGFSGRWGALTRLGTNVTSITGRIWPTGAYNPRRSEPAVLIPRFRQLRLDQVQASNAHPVSFPFERDELVLGFMVRNLDANAQVAGQANGRPDGMVRRIRAAMQGAGVSVDSIFEQRWGQLRILTADYFGLDAASVPSGVVFCPIVDRANPQYRNATLFPKGSRLDIQIDNSTAVEDHYAAITPATGDQAVLTLVSFERKLATPGAPAVPVGTLATASGASATTRRNGRGPVPTSGRRSRRGRR